MAKMRKRTKISLILLGVCGLAVACAALAIGLGAVTLFSQLVAFDIAILSAGVAIGAGVAAGSFALSGLVSRKLALKKSAESVADLAKAGQIDRTQEHAIVKQRDNSLKAARTFAKNSYSLSKFGIAPVTYEREHYGVSSQQLRLKSKQYVYDLMNDYYTQKGKTGVARKFDRKSQRVGVKASRESDVSSFAPKYHEAAEFFNPLTATWQTDERSSVYFNNSETAQAAKKIFEESVFKRYSDQNKRRGATTITIKSRGSNQAKEISASCNAEELVDTMETLALMDYAITVKKTGISGFPIMVETQEHKLDGSRKGKPEVMRINSLQELEERVYALNPNAGKVQTQTPTNTMAVYEPRESIFE